MSADKIPGVGAQRRRSRGNARPVLAPGHTYASVTDKISAITLSQGTPRGWLLGFGLAFLLVMVFLGAVTYLLAGGHWHLGDQYSGGLGFCHHQLCLVDWHWPCWHADFGHSLAHAPAVAHLDQPLCRSHDVVCRGLCRPVPALHLGRPWFAYWLIPYPNTMGMWPQFRSPLVWDFFAVSTYGTVSLLFWYIGLIPDLATLRDRSQSRLGRAVYGMLAMGWRGAARHWHRYETAYLLLAGLATPLVVSVHTIVSFDFAVALVPGWHSTILPPYFVAGAIFSGFAMVLTIAIPVRAVYHLEDFITMRHLRNMGLVMLATGLIVAYGYVMETFMAWYSGNAYEIAVHAQPHVWSLCPPVLGDAGLQCAGATGALVPPGARQRAAAVCDCPGGQRGHVAGALCHCHYQLASRLFALVVGHVLPDDVGLGDVYWHHRALCCPAVPVSALPADDFDF